MFFAAERKKANIWAEGPVMGLVAGMEDPCFALDLDDRPQGRAIDSTMFVGGFDFKCSPAKGMR